MLIPSTIDPFFMVECQICQLREGFPLKLKRVTYNHIWVCFGVVVFVCDKCRIYRVEEEDIIKDVVKTP